MGLSACSRRSFQERIAMPKLAHIAALAAMLSLAIPASFARTPPPGKTTPASIVIVFKDGHRQTFDLSTVARVEFSASTETASETELNAPTRARFLGKWEVGDGVGNNFFITLDENGDAHRSLNEERGRWVYINGEARVTWNDGAQDAIRKVGSKYQKFAYGAGKSFTDTPDNVTSARNTTPHPI
jgi:hypothetical protein